MPHRVVMAAMDILQGASTLEHILHNNMVIHNNMDTHHKDTHHKDTLHKVTLHRDTLHKDTHNKATHSKATLHLAILAHLLHISQVYITYDTQPKFFSYIISIKF